MHRILRARRAVREGRVAWVGTAVPEAMEAREDTGALGDMEVPGGKGAREDTGALGGMEFPGGKGASGDMEVLEEPEAWAKTPTPGPFYFSESSDFAGQFPAGWRRFY